MKIHEPGIYKYLTHKYVKSGHQCQLILGQLPPWIPNGFCSWGSWVILKQGAVVSLFALMVNCGACFLLALARCNSLKENGSCWEIVDLILVCCKFGCFISLLHQHFGFKLLKGLVERTPVSISLVTGGVCPKMAILDWRDEHSVFNIFNTGLWMQSMTFLIRAG